jgi:hypothetical protein
MDCRGSIRLYLATNQLHRHLHLAHHPALRASDAFQTVMAMIADRGVPVPHRLRYSVIDASHPEVGRRTLGRLCAAMRRCHQSCRLRNPVRCPALCMDAGGQSRSAVRVYPRRVCALWTSPMFTEPTTMAGFAARLMLAQGKNRATDRAASRRDAKMAAKAHGRAIQQIRGHSTAIPSAEGVAMIMLRCSAGQCE